MEVIFLYPWAVNFKALGMVGFVEMVLFITFVLADIVEMTEADAIALRDALNKMFPPVVQQTPYYIQPPPAFPHDDRKWEITSADTRTFKPKVI